MAQFKTAKDAGRFDDRSAWPHTVCDQPNCGSLLGRYSQDFDSHSHCVSPLAFQGELASTAERSATLRGAFTLLELILALSLSSIVLLAVGMAVQVQIHAYDSRRGVLEESQLARSLLRIIANDIRRTVVDYNQDTSVVEQLIASAKESAGSGGGGGGGAAAEGGSLSAGEESSNTEDLASTTVLPMTPGIYGNDSQLQIDISRLPRIDEYQQDYTSNPLSQLVDIPSDIKTVSYFVQTMDDAATAVEVDSLASINGGQGTSQGLIRRELDRAVTQWSMNNGSATAMMQGGDLLAPEVVGLQFQYFDGIQWLSEWDTEYQEALPLAIEVILMMQPSHEDLNSPSASSSEDSVRYYRLIVHVPVGVPAALDEELAAETETL